MAQDTDTVRSTTSTIKQEDHETSSFEQNKQDIELAQDKPAPESSPPNAPEYVTGIKLFAILASVTVASFLMLLDAAIVGTATPYITDEFHSLQDVGWYGSAYQLASAPLQPLTGKFYQKFNLKWVFLVFFGIFEVGSAICGAAQSSTMLIVGRAVAGIGASGLFNGSMIIVAASVPLQKRGPVTGIFMALSQLGGVCAPLIGGGFTSGVSWRWCFYINLPVGGLFGLFLIFLHIPEHTKKQPFLKAFPTLYKDLDLLGFSLMAPAAIMLLLALHYGGSQLYPWGSSVVIGLFVGSGVTCAVWFAWNWYRGPAALIPMNIFRRRVVWASALSMMWLFTTLFIISYFLPIYFQAVKGATPAMSGVYILPNIGGQLITSMLTGFTVNRTGYVLPYMVASCVVTATGTGLMSLFQPNTPTGEWVGFELISGLGRGLGLQMSFLAVQNGVKPFEIPVAITLLLFFQYMGTAIFLELSNTIFDQLLRHQVKVHVPGVDTNAVLEAGATHFRRVVSPSQIPLVAKAYADALDPIFILAAATAAAGILSVPFVGLIDVRKKKQQK